jgi:hypothetical protein
MLDGRKGPPAVGTNIASTSVPPPVAAGGASGGGPSPVQQVTQVPVQQAPPPVSAGGPTTDMSQVITALQQVVQGLSQLVSALQAQQAAAAANTGGGGPAGATAGCMGPDGTCTMDMSGGGGTPAADATGGADGAPTPTPNADRKPDTAGARSGGASTATKPAGAALLGHLTPNQLTDGKKISAADGKSACGPAAATAFARFLGKDTTLDDATLKAKAEGLWSQSEGMGGPSAEIKLIHDLGIKAHLDEGTPDWNKIKQTVMSGKPVIIGTPGHYWVAEQYDPSTGKFNFGKSGSVFASSHGNTWYSPAEMEGPGKGAPRATIYLDE